MAGSTDKCGECKSTMKRDVETREREEIIIIMREWYTSTRRQTITGI